MIVLLMLGVLVAQRQSGGRLAEAEGDLPSTDGGGNSADRLDDAVCVVEGGLRFELDLTRGEHIGLFFDSRPARGLVRSLAAGRRVLNLFAYSGGMCALPPPPPHTHRHPFRKGPSVNRCSRGVAAAAGGALSTTNVDNKLTFLKLAERNYALNKLPVDSRTFCCEDAVRFMKTAVRDSWRRYGLIILDPPPK